MSIPTELQEGSLQNLMLCMNTAVSTLQQMDTEKNVPDFLFRKLLVQTLCNLTVCIGSIGQCIIKDIETSNIMAATKIPN